jgi:dimethylhistidine N-methyltransferase
MSAAASPAVAQQIDEHVAKAVRKGLASWPKRLPPWLFFDDAGSQLFEAISELPEYYLTRTEREIFAQNAGAIIAQAADGVRLRIAELGAGSAEKTRLLLKAAVERQRTVLYEPVDVSASALDSACERIGREIPGVTVTPRVMDYTHGDGPSFHLDRPRRGDRQLVLYIGSSIGNFEPNEAAELLQRVRAGLKTGDSFLLGVDLVKEDSILLAAYDDLSGVTAAFNRNLLARLNRELDADFDPEAFAHLPLWNVTASRIELHLVSRVAQRVRLASLNLEVEFAAGESIHTENSYKYRPGQAEALLAEAGFAPAARWTDERGWFAVCLGRVE